MHDVSTARQKVKWAYQHIENFEAAYGTYLRENPQRFIANPNASKGSQKPKFVREDLTPPHLVCMIGDAVHNLRSAIDHVAFAIADHNGVTGKNLGIVNFPVREAKSDFNLAIKERKVSQIGAPWVAFLQRVEPYDGGKRSELVAVSLLDNIDKHRKLLVLASFFDTFRYDDTLGMVPVRSGIPTEEGVELALDPLEPNHSTHTQTRVVISEAVPGLDPNGWANAELRRFAYAVKTVIDEAETDAALWP